MAEQCELAVARMSCASCAGERRPGRDGRRGTSEMLAALYADHGSDLRRFAAGLTGDHGRAEDIVHHIDAAITQWDFAAALHGLHPRHRDLLAARYLRGHSIAEIAAALHLPAGTVKSRLAAARDVLRQRLQAGTGFRAWQETITGGRA
jgi:DNA-directed RNA polymerase specialized sigma24 family protein